MSEHISIADAQVCVLVHLVAGHFVDHRAFQMYDLIVRQR